MRLQFIRRFKQWRATTTKNMTRTKEKKRTEEKKRQCNNVDTRAKCKSEHPNLISIRHHIFSYVLAIFDPHFGRHGKCLHWGKIIGGDEWSRFYNSLL